MIFILLSMVAEINAFSPPLLIDVHVEIDQERLIISYKIDHFQEGINVEINIFQKYSKQMIPIEKNALNGSYGIISNKEDYMVYIDLSSLPDNFSLEHYICFPKLTFEGRIFYEMLHVTKGKHPAVVEEGVIGFERIGEFFISKFEVSNEQFAAFIQNDGYESYDYWKVKEGLMGNTEVGWFFQGKYFLNSPREWDLDIDEFWETAPSNFIYGPVTMMSWFEANACCHWMGGSLPELSQMQICFAKKSVENNSCFNPVSYEISESGGSLLHFIRSNVAEWIVSPSDSRASVCGPGCKEMFYLKNDNNNLSDYPVLGLSCPLFCNQNLGFRLVIVLNK